VDEERHDEIATLRSELSRMQRRLTELEAERADPRSDRRGFLKLAAGAAAGAVAASVSAASPAGAATNDAVLVGKTSTPTAVADTTTIESPSDSVLMPAAVAVRNYSDLSPNPDAGFRIAVFALTAGSDDSDGFRVGVFGEVDAGTVAGVDGRGIGLYGSSMISSPPLKPLAPIGVFGRAGNGGSGVRGDGVTVGSRGVHGRTQAIDGIAVHGEGVVPEALGVYASSPGIALRVEGGLHHVVAPGPGQPTGTHAIGEQHRDSLGDLYICVENGAPGVWRKVTAQHPSFAGAGGSINLLESPVRVVDTRLSGAQNNNGQRLAKNADVQFKVIGVGGSAGVPSGAKGIIGNATAIAPAGEGWLSLFPTIYSGTSNINYVPNQTTANAVTCALDAAGRLKVRSSETTTHFLLDIVGFLF
jgi:hypothetical protein